MGRNTAGKMESKSKHASRHVKHKSSAAAPIRGATLDKHLYPSQHHRSSPVPMDIATAPTTPKTDTKSTDSSGSSTSTDVVMHDASSPHETTQKPLTKPQKPAAKADFRQSLLSDKQKPNRSQSDEGMRL